MTPDMINGLFEFIGAIMLARNVAQLAKDKQIKGVHWGPVMFFMLWGVWNLFYYPSLGQVWSFFGGVCLVVVNVVWFLQIVYYDHLLSNAMNVWHDFTYGEQRPSVRMSKMDTRERFNECPPNGALCNPVPSSPGVVRCTDCSRTQGA